MRAYKFPESREEYDEFFKKLQKVFGNYKVKDFRHYKTYSWCLGTEPLLNFEIDESYYAAFLYITSKYGTRSGPGEILSEIKDINVKEFILFNLDVFLDNNEIL